MKRLLLLLLLIPNLLLGQCAGNQSFTLTPAPTNGTYEPGTVVTMCYTMNGWDTGFGSNWIEGFGIVLGPGWVSYTPISGPDDCGGVEVDQGWLWLETVTNDLGTLTVGPGYFYEGPQGTIDGNPGNDWGDFGTNCLWTFCVQLQVSDECDPLSLLIEVTPYADGTMGSWGNESCFDPAFQVFTGTIAGGDVETSPIQIPTDTICIGSTQTYSVINTVGSTYDWTLSGGGILTENTSNIITIDWGGVPGDYVITVQETTVDGCIGDIISTTITVADTLIVFSQPTTGICLGDTVHLNAIPNDGYWSGGNLTGNVYTGNTPGYQFIKYTANIYGCNVTDSIRIFVRELFVAPTISGLQYINLCLLDPTQTYYTVDDPSIEYTWLMGNKTLLDVDYDLQITWPDSTLSYILEVFGTDTIGCKSEVGYINVDVKACHRIFVPNSFTPNGDSYNDAFKVAGSAVYDLDFKIYNRFGDVVHRMTSTNEYWNGNDGSGYYCPTGIYNWIANYSDDEGFKHIEKGHIILIR
jgi:gliding motility-associated-like protein